MNFNALRIGLCLAVLVFAWTGCAWFQPKEESAQELAVRGMQEYNRGNYQTAIAAFEKLKDWYPFSKYTILAELKIADSYYQDEMYEDAAYAYGEFEKLHPLNEAVPYAVYQIGRCYFDQLDTVDRDQTPAQKALDTFIRLTRQYPESKYALRAKGHINDCLKSLAGHEFYVGMFYFKSDHYEAALSRFQAIIAHYPDVGIHQKALQYIALCEQRLAAETGGASN